MTLARRGVFRGAAAVVAAGLGSVITGNAAGQVAHGAATQAIQPVKGAIANVEEIVNAYNGIKTEADRLVSVVTKGGTERQAAESATNLKKVYEAKMQLMQTDWPTFGVTSVPQSKQLIQDLDQVISTAQSYGQVPMTQIFNEYLNGLNAILIKVDSGIESNLPQWWQQGNDAIRRIFGQPYGPGGLRERQRVADKVNTLKQIYGTRRDALEDQKVVLDTVTKWLKETPDLNKEERVLLEYIVAEAENKGVVGQAITPAEQNARAVRVRDFILNYEKAFLNPRFKPENYQDAQTWMLKSMETYTKVREGTTKAMELQGVVRQADTQITQVNAYSIRITQETSALKKQIDSYNAQVSALESQRKTDTDTYNKLVDELNGLRAKETAQLQDYNAEVRTQRQAVDRLTGSLKTIEDELRAKGYNIRSGPSDLRDMKQAVDAFPGQAGEVARTLGTVVYAALALYTAGRVAMHNRMQGQKHELADLRNQVSALEAQNTALEAQIRLGAQPVQPYEPAV